MSTTLLSIENLNTTFSHKGKTLTAVNNLSLSINAGELFALVGESGSGKSVTAHSILRLLPYPKAEHNGRILFNGEDLLNCSEDKIRRIRGADIAMIFQEPMSALNPLKSIEKQIVECLPNSASLNKKEQHQQIIALLEQVKIDDAEKRLGAYPHQLSGGQRQRVMIAMAIANKPKMLIADEPTTALDVTVQADILSLLQDLQQQTGMAILLITHDLALVKHYADTVAVMCQGEIVEQNSCTTLFEDPQHNYTQSLLASNTNSKSVLQSTQTLLTCDNLNVIYHSKKPLSFKKTRGELKGFHAVKDVSFSLMKGESLGIIGESGSGKSSLANALLKLTPASGNITYNGCEVSSLAEKAFRPYRRQIQVVFQDPFSSLSPRCTIEDIIAEGLKAHHQIAHSDVESSVIKALNDVAIDPECRHRYPHEFSGGQRQRIAIARALIMQPECIILDEPTSALDRTVQFQVLDLLLALQQSLNLSYIFISHDLRLVESFCHHVLIMKEGRVIESGETDRVFSQPRNDYTKQLLTATL